jgi:hypothetical protein
MLLFVFPKVVVSWKLPKICTYFYFSHCSKSKYKKVLPISKNIFKPDKKQQKSQEHSYFINIITVCIVGITKLCYTSSINVTKVNVMSTSEFEFILSNEIHTLEKLNKSTITSVMGFTFIIEKQQYV